MHVTRVRILTSFSWFGLDDSSSNSIARQVPVPSNRKFWASLISSISRHGTSPGPGAGEHSVRDFSHCAARSKQGHKLFVHQYFSWLFFMILFYNFRRQSWSCSWELQVLQRKQSINCSIYQMDSCCITTLIGWVTFPKNILFNLLKL